LLSKMATQQHRSKYDVSMKTLYRFQRSYFNEIIRSSLIIRLSL